MFDMGSMPDLMMRCPDHGERVKDWSSDLKPLYRVVIYWRDGKAGFALHEVEYDQYGFPKSIGRSVSPVYDTTADLAHEARVKGYSMEEVSDIFNDRYLEYREYFPEQD